ncbi:unnamed protein product [Blepharisma stoltei]|uniref:GSKIP domain-containing protein n=1 Tax=Blepharisma stoltei TaxID=1481888 RepID=A0AAU9ISW7_9CILI|nr:unnamed protein product [Blepharisma stoltei]
MLILIDKNMNIEEEVADIRPHVNELVVKGNEISIITKEGIEIDVEMNTNGIRVIRASIEIQRNAYDDVNQMLTEVSEAYRDSFSQELMNKLMGLT